MIQLMKNAVYSLMGKWVEEASLPVCEVGKKRDELSFFSLSTNPIISFEHEGEIWYFRECLPIMHKEAYWTAVIDRFFNSLDRLGINRLHFSQEIPVRIHFDEKELRLFRTYIEGKCKERKFRRMLANSDVIAKKVCFSIWEKQIYNDDFFAKFALEDLPEGCKDIAVYFLWNMRAAAGNYHLLKIVRGRSHSFFAATKAIASRIVAEELNLAHMITPVQWCRLMVDDGTTIFGAISPSAPGQRMMDSAITLTGMLQRELLCLNIMDVICFQQDHGPNNYNVAMDADGVPSICAFDNDNPKTFFPAFSICCPIADCSGLVDPSNQIQRPYIPKDFARHLRNIDKSRLRRRLKPYLNRLQIAAVCFRLERINRAIINTEKKRPDFLKDVGCWNARTVEEEMSGKYGKTYLKKISGLNTSSTL